MARRPTDEPGNRIRQGFARRSSAPPFFYLDLTDTRRRAALLTATVRDKIPTLASLKREYARALAQIGNAPLDTANRPRVVSGGPILRLTSARGLVDNSVHPSSYRPEARSIAKRRVQRGLRFLRRQHPPLRDLCDLLLTDILVWPSARTRSATASNLLGIAWLSPSDDLTSCDIAECVVHEMVHLNLHLTDMTFGLFTRAPGSDFEAHSAVLGRRRPYYHAFHSACVAVAVIYFRLLVGPDSETSSLCSSLRRCTSELLAHEAAFTDCAWNAILAAHAFSRTPKLAAIPVHKDLMEARLIMRSSDGRPLAPVRPEI
jgi:hypothetical protein